MRVENEAAKSLQTDNGKTTTPSPSWPLARPRKSASTSPHPDEWHVRLAGSLMAIKCNDASVARAKFWRQLGEWGAIVRLNSSSRKACMSGRVTMQHNGRKNIPEETCQKQFSPLAGRLPWSYTKSTHFLANLLGQLLFPKKELWNFEPPLGYLCRMGVSVCTGHAENSSLPQSTMCTCVRIQADTDVKDVLFAHNWAVIGIHDRAWRSYAWEYALRNQGGSFVERCSKPTRNEERNAQIKPSAQGGGVSAAVRTSTWSALHNVRVLHIPLTKT